MKKLIIFLFTLLSFTSNIYGQTKSKPIEVDFNKIDYILPYPGILPDHILYPIKSIRDNLLLFFNRDNLKKSKLYHLLADKQAASAQILLDKGKGHLAISTINQAEINFGKSIEYISQSKKQGISIDGQSLLNMKLSIKKHQEIIENLFKFAPKTNMAILENSLKINKQIQSKLNKIPSL